MWAWRPFGPPQRGHTGPQPACPLRSGFRRRGARDVGSGASRFAPVCVPHVGQRPSSRGITCVWHVGQNARSSAGSTLRTRTSVWWLARRARSATRLTAASSSRSACLVSLAVRSLNTKVPSWRRASSPTSHSRRTASCTSRALHGPATASASAGHGQPDGPGGEQRLVDVLADRDRLLAHRFLSSVSVTTRRPPAIGAVHRCVPSRVRAAAEHEPHERHRLLVRLGRALYRPPVCSVSAGSIVSSTRTTTSRSRLAGVTVAVCPAGHAALLIVSTFRAALARLFRQMPITSRAFTR